MVPLPRDLIEMFGALLEKKQKKAPVDSMSLWGDRKIYQANLKKAMKNAEKRELEENLRLILERSVAISTSMIEGMKEIVN